MARIQLTDLPECEDIPLEEMLELFGAGRYRLSFEEMEDRQLMSAGGFFAGTGLDRGDVARAQVAMEDGRIVEGDVGARDLLFRVTRQGDLSRPLDVAFAATEAPTRDATGLPVVGPRATAGQDFTPVRGVVSFAAGADSATVRVPVVGDRIAEGNETLTVGLLDATFQEAARGDEFAQTVVAADFNQDGRPDLATANLRAGRAGEASSLSVFVNSTAPGSGQTAFAPRQTFAGGEIPEQLVAADFNRDGRPDLAVIESGTQGFIQDGAAPPSRLTVLLNTTAPGSATVSFAPPQRIAAPWAIRDVVAADFNRDGRTDLAFAHDSLGKVALMANLTAPGASTVNFAAAQTVSEAGAGGGLQAADLNNDGRVDLVAGVGNETLNTWMNSTPAGAQSFQFARGPGISVGERVESLVVADVNADGRPDVVGATLDSNKVVAALNVTAPGAAPAFGTPQVFAAGQGRMYSLQVNDVTGDGKADVVLGSSGTGASVLENRTAAGTTTPAFGPEQVMPVAPDMLAAGLAVADFNGNGRPAIAAAGGRMEWHRVEGWGDPTVPRLDGGGTLLTVLADGTPMSFRRSQAMGTIQDNDALPTVRLSINPLRNKVDEAGEIRAARVEGGSRMGFEQYHQVRQAGLLREAASVTVTLSLPSEVPVTVQLGFGGSATPGADFTGPWHIAGEPWADGTLFGLVQTPGAVVIPPGAISQTVYFLPRDDYPPEGKETAVVTATSADNATLDGTQSVQFSVLDDDATNVGIIVTPIDGGELHVAEGGVGRSISVRLTDRPTANVSLSLSAGNQLRLSSPRLVFTPGNWDVPQTVTVSAADDDALEGLHTARISFFGTSQDNRYQSGVRISSAAKKIWGLVIQPITVTVEDNESGVVVTPPTGGARIAEGGSTATYTLALAAKPTADVTLTLQPDGQLRTSTSSLRFTPDNWDRPQTITVSAVNDVVYEGTHPGVIRHSVASTDARFNGTPVANLTATITDNDARGILLVESSGSTVVTEGGASDTYTLALAYRPTADVTITLQIDAQVSLSATRLVFTPANWNVPQTVAIRAANDTAVEGTTTSVIRHTVASTDARFQGSAVPDVRVSVADNDHGVVIRSEGDLQLAEGGATDSYGVRLATRPTAPVTVALLPDEQVTASPATLVFTPDNWNVEQRVTVTAVEDTRFEGAHSGVIRHTVASTDARYSGVAVASVTARITDNDSGVRLSNEGARLTVTPTQPGRYAIALNERPTSAVTIYLTVESHVGLSTTALVFTPDNWNVPRTVVVRGRAVSGVMNTPPNATIRHTVVSADPRFNGLAIADVGVLLAGSWY